MTTGSASSFFSFLLFLSSFLAASGSFFSSTFFSSFFSSGFRLSFEPAESLVLESSRDFLSLPDLSLDLLAFTLSLDESLDSFSLPRPLELSLSLLLSSALSLELLRSLPSFTSFSFDLPLSSDFDFFAGFSPFLTFSTASAFFC